MTPTSEPHLLVLGLGYSAGHWAAALAARGWRITGTCRSAEKARRLADAGFPIRRFERGRLLDLAGLAPVTHVLVSIPPDPEGCPALAELAGMLAALRPAWLGYLSTTGVYGDRDGAWVDESMPPTPRQPRTRRRVAAEQGWLAWGVGAGVTVQVFRLAGIYGPGRSALDELVAGTARRLDKPGQVFSRIHVADIAGALDAALAARLGSLVFNVCDDLPAASAAVVAEAARLLGRAPPPLIPLAEAELSPMAAEFWSECRRVDNSRLKRLSGWRPLHPTYREGLAACLGAHGTAAGEDGRA